MLKQIIFIISILFCYTISAQNESSIWYFGEQAGLDFNSANPIPINSGQTNAFGATATISDTNGNLLFYTDGITVWDRQHNNMPNGTGLMAHVSSSQMAVVPVPNQTDLYYIITGFFVQPQQAGNGYRYSLLDMSLNNGFGDIVASQKNILLEQASTTKATVVKHANQTDYWVVLHKDDSTEYLSYLVDEDGLNTTPVISNGSFNVSTVADGGGQMKASHDGSKLASVFSGANLVELLEFNTNTGQVSNPIVLDGFDSGIVQSNVFGTEFSPNSQLLYVGENIDGIFQFDISNYNVTDIQNSKTFINAVGIDTPAIGDWHQSLQIGVDGKIYVASQDRGYLGVIHEPNLSGNACNYVYKGIFLNGGISQVGLPAILYEFFSINIEYENTCVGQEVIFQLNANKPVSSINWDFGDTNTSSLENPTHTYDSSGTYIVDVIAISGTETIEVSFEITISELPTANPIVDYVECSVDEFIEFDLSIKDSEILNGQSTFIFDIAYYLTEQDLLDNTNQLPTLFTNTTNPQQIFAKIFSNNSSDCYDYTSFNLRVNIQPVANQPDDSYACDINDDGIYTFDLSDFEAEILGSQDSATYTITFYASLIDAENDFSPLNTLYTTSTNSETIYARVEHNQDENCFDTTPLNLVVSTEPNIGQADNLIVCDDESNDGVAQFDLTEQNGSILNGGNPNDFNITYHLSQSDADLGVNTIALLFENTSNPQTIFCRMENVSASECFATSFFEINVVEQPVILMDDIWSICENESIEIIADAGFDQYLWSTGETTQNITVDEPGSYQITVWNNYEDISCEATKSISIIESELPTIIEIESSDWSLNDNRIVITISGNGDYEYSLDGIEYQDSNEFLDVNVNEGIVYVRDKNGCGIVTQEFYLLFYPKFFTPNNDGNNDTWQLINSHREPRNKLFIYDRYGKLIKQLSPNSNGWDGSFNGTPLLTSDYWFVLERQNGKQYTGHFTLKR